MYPASIPTAIKGHEGIASGAVIWRQQWLSIKLEEKGADQSSCRSGGIDVNCLALSCAFPPERSRCNAARPKSGRGSSSNMERGGENRVISCDSGLNVWRVEPNLL